MSRDNRRRPEEIARQWQLLAERRREHLAEMQRSGRWRRYYTEEKLKSEMQDASRRVEGWTALIKPAAEPQADIAPQRDPREKS